MHTMAVHLTTGWPLVAAAAALAVIVVLVVLILLAVRRARRRAAAVPPEPATSPAPGTGAGTGPAPATSPSAGPATAAAPAGGAVAAGTGTGDRAGQRLDAGAAGAGGRVASTVGGSHRAADQGERAAAPGERNDRPPAGAASPGGNGYAGAVPAAERRWSEIDMRELAAASRQLARPVLRGVVTGSSGEPLADAVLTVINVRGGQAGNARTGADGGYQLTMPAEGGYVVIARGVNHEPHAATVEVHGVLTTCDIRLASSAGLTGTVADADGSPLPGATVILTNTAGAVVSAQRSNGRGGFGVTDLAPGLYTVTATAPAREPVALLVDVPPTGVVRQDVTFPPRTLTLTGTTRRDDGRPLVDVQVSIVDGSGTVVATTYSDESGHYECGGLAPGRYTVVASGYPRVSAPLDAVDRVERHDITLGYAGAPAATDTVDEEYAR